MHTITVIFEDTISALTEVTSLLGSKKVNIDSVLASSVSGQTVLTLSVDKHQLAKSALIANGYKVLESEAILVRLDEGNSELAAISSKMAKAGININGLHVVGREGGCVLLALRVDKAAAAKKLLKGYVL